MIAVPAVSECGKSRQAILESGLRVVDCTVSAGESFVRSDVASRTRRIEGCRTGVAPCSHKAEQAGTRKGAGRNQSHRQKVEVITRAETTDAGQEQAGSVPGNKVTSECWNWNLAMRWAWLACRVQVSGNLPVASEGEKQTVTLRIILTPYV